MSQSITKTLTAHEFFKFLGHFDYITFSSTYLNPEAHLRYTCRTNNVLLDTDKNSDCVLRTDPSDATNVSIYGSAYACTVVLHDGLCTFASAHPLAPRGDTICIDLFNQVS